MDDGDLEVLARTAVADLDALPLEEAVAEPTRLVPVSPSARSDVAGIDLDGEALPS